MENFTSYNPRFINRLKTMEVSAGSLKIGNFYPVRIQTMTTTDTMDTIATVNQVIKCVEYGAELVRITTPSLNEANNLVEIKKRLQRLSCHVPIVADVHFTPGVAEVAARIIEKVRINPGNYADKKKFELTEYSDSDYERELERVCKKATPLLKICKEYGTALRIGVNHGSLSDRIMNRFGDTPMGMVESAMEFLRFAEAVGYQNIVVSMKSSRPKVMVEAYRLLVSVMIAELGHCYPIHLGVTESGSGVPGRIKSALGIGSLLEEGIGDTIRVSLTEAPEFELPVCRELVSKYAAVSHSADTLQVPDSVRQPYIVTAPGKLRSINGRKEPLVIADLSGIDSFGPEHLAMIGFSHIADSNTWESANTAPDMIYLRDVPIIPIPPDLKVIVPGEIWSGYLAVNNIYPIWSYEQFSKGLCGNFQTAFIEMDVEELPGFATRSIVADEVRPGVVLNIDDLQAVVKLKELLRHTPGLLDNIPVILKCSASLPEGDPLIIHYVACLGSVLLEGCGDGIWLRYAGDAGEVKRIKELDLAAFGILQATHLRIFETEYISCPSCGRTLFDLEQTTERIQQATGHLKGVKVAVMGCIVNGPGEMADADFGYVGSGPGRINLYKGKDVVLRNVDSDSAVSSLIELIKASGMWEEPFKKP
ncbi:(E)-4-hydroxy-3-methylbut-2-enyl-diphosphate synthase [Chitinophaga sp. Mgbs1]|uniref:4-hydroxy-3-methylbut-2-en-1-yl diphosphate synthase (flavodoxin) n=1 Tax=Chitinophaga solisilvae TaxID=1233460 RepID=A0A3S1D1E2_9BACT|nr:(E)-4-hydroxy-3-methylbut-2-enyl-diphosphate synthase [Chitinophaga solisilvae]